MKELTWPGKRGKRLIVEDKYNWLTWDCDGEAWVSVQEPRTGGIFWCGGGMKIGNCKPPEPGSWYEQLYWIGDD